MPVEHLALEFSHVYETYNCSSKSRFYTSIPSKCGDVQC